MVSADDDFKKYSTTISDVYDRQYFKYDLKFSNLIFLGIGVKVPQPEWGAMLNEGRLSFEQAPWLMIAPGLAITLTIIMFNGIHH